MEKNSKILIAEDDRGHFLLIKRNLWLACVENEIINFRDGQEILDFLFTGPHEDSETSYIILLDIRMPKVDGREVLRRLKQNTELAKIPVIMLTTTDDETEIEKCYELGCNSYVVKPADYTKFMEVVENLGAFLCLDSLKIPEIQPEKV